MRIWSVNTRDWVFVYGMGCSLKDGCLYMGWSVSTWDGVLVNRLGC